MKHLLKPLFAIRGAVRADAQALLEHLRELQAERLDCLPKIRILPTLEEEVAYVEELSGNGLLKVAFAGSRVVGVLSITRPSLVERRHSGTLGMSVTREFRRRGIGRSLLRHAGRWALQEGVKRVELAVFSNNVAARALYESEGFKVEGIQRHGACVEGAYVDIMLMCLYV